MPLVPIRVPPLARRATKIAAFTTIFLALAGTTYQGVATAVERQQYPHPGRLVSIGDFQLHIHCLGEGVPTVVLEAPATASSAAWGAVQPVLAGSTRVCAYDRGGLGWSEAGDRKYDPSRVPDDLRTLLDAAGEQGPFVLVGQGLGAAFARAFAARFPERTAALVLVDAPAPNAGLRPGRLTTVNAVTPWLARVGILRALRTAQETTRELPDRSRGAMRTFLYRPDHLSRAAAELADVDAAIRLAYAAPPAVTPLEVVQSDGASGLLTDAPTVARVVDAVERAVAAVRRPPR